MVEMLMIGYIMLCSPDLIHCEDFESRVWSVEHSYMDHKPYKDACEKWKDKVIATAGESRYVLVGKCYMGLLDRN